MCQYFVMVKTAAANKALSGSNLYPYLHVRSSSRYASFENVSPNLIDKVSCSNETRD